MCRGAWRGLRGGGGGVGRGGGGVGRGGLFPTPGLNQGFESGCLPGRAGRQCTRPDCAVTPLPPRLTSLLRTLTLEARGLPERCPCMLPHRSWISPSGHAVPAPHKDWSPCMCVCLYGSHHHGGSDGLVRCENLVAVPTAAASQQTVPAVSPHASLNAVPHLTCPCAQAATGS